MGKIKINTNCVADTYADHGREKIIEFSSPGGGGLIAFRLNEAGNGLLVTVYNTDGAVSTVASAGEGKRRTDTGALTLPGLIEELQREQATNPGASPRISVNGKTRRVVTVYDTTVEGGNPNERQQVIITHV